MTQEESKLPDVLEEAAKKYLDGVFEKGKHQDFYVHLFIAGAEWQKKRDDLETADLLAIAHLQGMEQQKSKMMKDAVGGEVMLNPYPTICLDDCKDYDFKDGNKVRIIIVKEELK